MRISKAVQFLKDKNYLDRVVNDVYKSTDEDIDITIREWLSDLDTSWELGGNLTPHVITVKNYIKKLAATS